MYQLKASANEGKNIIAVSDYDNDLFQLDLQVTSHRIKGTLTAKQDLVMQSFVLTEEREYDKKDRFFGNGYQAWSTTREYSRKDTMPGYNKIANITPLSKQLMTVMSDYRFAEYGEKGVFHSWTYTYFRQKGSRDICFYGSRTEKNGFTQYIADMNKGTFAISKDLEGLTLLAGEVYPVLDLAILSGDYDAVFDEYFFDFVGAQPPKVTRMAGYTSWYNYFQNINEDIILRDLEGFDEAADLTTVFQIDDGYEPAVGDWLVPDEKKFPHGMNYVTDAIHGKGYKAGLWVAPFSVQVTSTLAKKHPDWILRDEKGKKLLTHLNWGGAYSLDIYNPEVRDYIFKVFHTILEDWNFDMVKLDFLYCISSRPYHGKTRGEIMCDGVQLLREACGDKIILGCGVPLGACMGVFDACRIGSDAHKNWKGDIFNKMNLNNEVPCSRTALTNALFRHGLDGRAFANDPDVFFLRDTNIKYTEEQKLVLGKINDVTGSVLFVSDNAGDYTEKEMGYLKHFFTEKDYEVKLVEFESANVVRLDFVENGVAKTLKLNLKTGKSNIREVL